MFGELDHSVQPGQLVVFGEGSDGERLLGGGWSLPDAAGVWTDGDRARLVLELGADPLSEAVLVLDVVPFVTPEHAELTVDVWAGDTHVARRVFRENDLEGRFVLRLPPSVRDERGRAVVDFRLDEPARPVDLGLGSDARRLGLHLRSLMLDGRLTVRVGELTEFAQQTGLSGFGDGWAFLHDEGIWTRGYRSDLALALSGTSDAEYRLVLSVVGAHAPFEGTRTLELLVNGELASVRPLTSSDCVFTWRVDLPAHVVAGGKASVTLVASEYQSAGALDAGADLRKRWLHVDAIGLEEVDRSLGVGQVVAFIEGSGAERFLGSGWSALEPTGVWTIADRARVMFRLPADAGRGLELVLGSHAYVAPGHPALGVAFTGRDGRLVTRLFRHGVKSRPVPIPLTGAVVGAHGRVVVDIEIDHPVSPKELGTGADTRPLGLYLKWLTVRRTGARGRWDAVQRRLRRATRQRIPN
jgi:hypothetical protein